MFALHVSKITYIYIRTRLTDLVEAMPMTTALPETVFTQVKDLTLSALEPRPRDGVHLAAVAGDARVCARNQLHLRDQARPVGLLGEVHCDVFTIGADGCG